MSVLIVTSKTCGFCTQFKANTLDSLVKRIEKDYNVKHVDLDDFATGQMVNLAPEIPCSVQKYITWFPTILYFPDGYVSEPKVFNGTVKGSKVEFTDNNPFTTEPIVNWINSFAPPEAKKKPNPLRIGERWKTS